MYKQVIIFLKGLNLEKSQVAELSCSYSVEIVDNMKSKYQKKIHSWIHHGQKKIVARVDSKKELDRLENTLLRRKFSFLKIYRNSKEIQGNINTDEVLGIIIGPEQSNELDEVTGNLKLF